MFGSADTQAIHGLNEALVKHTLSLAALSAVPCADVTNAAMTSFQRFAVKYRGLVLQARTRRYGCWRYQKLSPVHLGCCLPLLWAAQWPQGSRAACTT